MENAQWSPPGPARAPGRLPFFVATVAAASVLALARAVLGRDESGADRRRGSGYRVTFNLSMQHRCSRQREASFVATAVRSRRADAALRTG